MGLSITSEPAVEPVVAADFEAWQRIDSDDAQSTTTTLLLKAARRSVERDLKRQLITATYALTLPTFPKWSIELPRPPLQSITSIQYVDTGETTQTLAATRYQADTDDEPGLVMPASGDYWPTVDAEQADGVTITYKAGYGDAATDVPDDAKLAILMLAGTWYENREAVITGTIATPIPDHVHRILNGLRWTAIH